MIEIKNSILNLNAVSNEMVNQYISLFPHRYTKEKFNWEFVEIPGKNICTIATVNDKIICTQAFLPIELKKGSEIFQTHKSASSLLIPDYRGTSVFKDLYTIGVEECFQNHSNLIWGFTPAVKVWREKLGFNVIENEIYEAKVYLPSTFHFRNKGIINSIKSLFSQFKKFRIKSKLSNKKTTQTLNIQDNFSDFEHYFIDTFNQMNNISRINLTQEYLNWRTINNPNNQFKAKLVYFEKKVIGYYIYSIQENANLVYLSEITAKNEDNYSLVFNCLIEELLNYDITSISYFGNIKNTNNSIIFKLFNNKLNGEVNILEWASIVLKMNNNSSIIPNVDASNLYINGLWTEGYSY